MMADVGKNFSRVFIKFIVNDKKKPFLKDPVLRNIFSIIKFKLVG